MQRPPISGVICSDFFVRSHRRCRYVEATESRTTTSVGYVRRIAKPDQTFASNTEEHVVSYSTILYGVNHFLCCCFFLLLSLVKKNSTEQLVPCLRKVRQNVSYYILGKNPRDAMRKRGTSRRPVYVCLSVCRTCILYPNG